MKIIYAEQPSKENLSVIERIANACGILEDTARLLFLRGVDTIEKAKRFLSPGKEGFFDPYLFKGMESAVKRIILARTRGENVLIFGDYDADGISACVVLTNALKVFGLNAKTIVPEREEGYGLNVDKIIGGSDTDKPSLVITVDCGVSDREKIERLKSAGVDVIVTDHHEPPEILPDCIVINPKVADSGYPFEGLCGAGVAYKLAYALIGDAADEYLDFVALATVSDSMDLIGENRDIVFEGLKLFNGDKLRKCFLMLLNEGGKTVTAQTLAFSLAPKVNAGGRMGDAASSLKLFLSESLAEIAEKAELLKSYNVERQTECESIYKQAKSILGEKETEGVIVVYGEGWSTGFTGIVAARLAEEYGRPAIVFGEQNGILKGSARSVEGVNVYEIISSAKELLTSFGGHAGAAGVGVEKANFSAFKTVINEYFEREYKDLHFEETYQAEWEINKPLSPRFIREIELLEPFGMANRRPVFGVKTGKVTPKPLRDGSPHYFFNTDVLEMLDFNGEADVTALKLPIEKTVLFETNRSVYKNRESVKGFVKKVVYNVSTAAAAKNEIISHEIDKLRFYKSAKKAIALTDYSQTIKAEAGTIYIVSDPSNMPKNLSGVKFGVFDVPSDLKNGALIVSPNALPSNCKKAVYLDEPAFFLDSDAPAFCNYAVKGYNYILNVNPARDMMASYYREISGCAGENFSDLTDFYASHGLTCGIENFLFAVKVFLELGIFELKNGKLIMTDVKSKLTDSAIYNAVVELKGRI